MDNQDWHIIEAAREVLEKNWVALENGDGFTKPASTMYPFQWNWDSGFIALGYRHHDIDRAVTELRTLFRGQWDNGFLPHIVFHREVEMSDEGYFPDPDFWDVQGAAEDAPTSVKTSGITQPPLHGVVVWALYDTLSMQDEERARDFLEEFYPKLYRLHHYLHTERDPEKWGMMTIVHPWESGFDNSPRWDTPLSRIGLGELPPYSRLDTTQVDATFRPTDGEYDRFIYLLMCLREEGYGGDKLYNRHEFKVKDKVCSSLLYRGNRALLAMADILGEDDSSIRTWMERFEKNMDRILWNEEDALFYDYDLVTAEQIRVHTVGSLLPIITGMLDDRRMQALVQYLDRANFCGQRACAVHLAPSAGIYQEHFNATSYWRGPIWINVNWLLWDAFREIGMEERATHMRRHILSLVAREGFWEYYSPLTGEGIGARGFSWSAALAIDLVCSTAVEPATIAKENSLWETLFNKLRIV